MGSRSPLRHIGPSWNDSNDKLSRLFFSRFDRWRVDQQQALYALHWIEQTQVKPSMPWCCGRFIRLLACVVFASQTVFSSTHRVLRGGHCHESDSGQGSANEKDKSERRLQRGYLGVETVTIGSILRSNMYGENSQPTSEPWFPTPDTSSNCHWWRENGKGRTQIVGSLAISRRVSFRIARR